MKKLLITAAFLCPILFTIPHQSAAQTELFTSLKYRAVNWNNLEESMSIDNNNFRTVDFTIKASNKLSVGLMLDLGDRDKAITNWAARLGLGDWGMLIEKGNINGSFDPTADQYLDIQPSGTFEGDYNLYAIYTGNYANVGATYVSYSMPSEIWVHYPETYSDGTGWTYESETFVSYMDPEAEYSLIGGYFAIDGLRSFMQDDFTLLPIGESGGFLLASEVAAGYAVGTVSEAYRASVEQVTGAEITYKSRHMLAMYGGLMAGYMTKYDFQKQGTLGFSAGFQYRLHGEFLSFNGDEEMLVAKQDMWDDINYGFFVRLAYTW